MDLHITMAFYVTACKWFLFSVTTWKLAMWKHYTGYCLLHPLCCVGHNFHTGQYIKPVLQWDVDLCYREPILAPDLQGKYRFSRKNLCSYREREMFYLTTHSTHFIYGYMASDIWLRTILIVRKETRCCHIGYSYQWTARVLLYAPSHRQDNTYHGLCYTSRETLAGTRNSSMGPPHEGSIRWPIAPWEFWINVKTLI